MGGSSGKGGKRQGGGGAAGVVDPGVVVDPVGETGLGGGGGGGVDVGCPATVRARLPIPGGPILHVGEAVTAGLGATSPETVIAIHSASGTAIGVLAGIPDLAQLIRCLRNGVEYGGSVDSMDADAFGIVLWRS